MIAKNKIKFKVHRAVLAAHSPVFAEGKSITLEEYDPSSVAFALYFLSTGKLNKQNEFPRDGKQVIAILEQLAVDQNLIKELKKLPSKKWHTYQLTSIQERHPALSGKILKKTTDITIKLADGDHIKRIQAHKVFLSKLKGSRKKNNELEITGISESALKGLLDYLYVGSSSWKPSECQEIIKNFDKIFGKISKENKQKLIYNLVQTLSSKLKRDTVELETVAEILVIASKYKVNELANRCIAKFQPLNKEKLKILASKKVSTEIMNEICRQPQNNLENNTLKLLVQTWPELSDIFLDRKKMLKIEGDWFNDKCLDTLKVALTNNYHVPKAIEIRSNKVTTEAILDFMMKCDYRESFCDTDVNPVTWKVVRD